MIMYRPRDTSDVSSSPTAAADGAFQGTGNLYANSVAWIIVSGFVVGLRIFTRLRIVKSPGLDDMLIVVAMVC